MIQLLFLVLFMEGIVALLLMIKIGPLRELTMKGLDQLKMGRGPATVKTLACTMAVIMASSITSILKIQNRGLKIGTVTPMDQVLWRTHLLEASLIGYSLFLALVIDRMHNYLSKLSGSKKTLGNSKQQAKKFQEEYALLKEKQEKASEEIRALKEEISSLTERLQKLKLESDEKEKRAQAAEANVIALQKQSEDLLLEYDRLLEDNQILQSQTLMGAYRT
ncbi:B-cell receptor-associated protein 31 [Amborella trichopoda]|uniref:Endoplasmic reticulum transmembrane protein n=1 Tax=Amborella trichopoda TaxID=13333 RepID=W1NQB5_AMBTC|nr:B-cell receptor-associated protein 31 [Amborella trichopoda]ERM97942.1 hypothetical protein AMTR_s00117p00045900 [Amborella trichopoda]|eukprot:XP_006830526.1 B-cell receptor-associated protein 31 [Amborella trichopoda]